MVAGANSARKMLQHIPMGTPMAAAPKVTEKEPTIIGNTPNFSWLGAHSSPNTKSKNPTFALSKR
jgi:hypothetical protein